MIHCLLNLYRHVFVLDFEVFIFISPTGAFCYPGHRFTDCLNDAGHHGSS